MVLARLRKAISTVLYGEVLPQDLRPDERRALWPLAAELSSMHTRNCQVVPGRVQALDLMPRGGVCAEVGVLLGDYSDEILRKMEPKALHLIDMDEQWIEGARRRFSREVECGQVMLHKGDSSTILRSMPQASLDWVYIDGDHTYEGCKKDVEAAAECLRPEGVIAFNDYTFFGPSDFCKYGVMEAVNEFCVNHDFEFVYLALQGRGYHDVAIRRLAATN